MIPVNTEVIPKAPLDAAHPDTALVTALGRLLAPVARLCLANGVPFAAVEDIMKRAFVNEAGALQPGGAAHGMVSRISTATGISRREVARLTAARVPIRAVKPPLATEIFARWTTDHELRDQHGAPCSLKRQGPAPSFEALAQTITRDVHPRSMLDELIRLGIVQHDEELDCVSLTRSDFVPGGDSRSMLGLLGDNVGDHLDAAVDNVLHDGGRHLEQAVFADELSAESIEAIRPLVTTYWQALRDAMVPVITDLIEADRQAGRMQNQRMRVGLYSFAESAPNAATPTNEPETCPKRKSTKKECPT